MLTDVERIALNGIAQRVEQIAATVGHKANVLNDLGFDVLDVSQKVADLEARISELQNQVDALAALKARFGVR